MIEIELCGAETMHVIGQPEEYKKGNKITSGQILKEACLHESV